MTVVANFLARAKRRIVTVSAMGGAGVGIIVAIVVVIGLGMIDKASAPRTFISVAAVVGALLGAIAGAALASRRRAAIEIERRSPVSRNLVLTAAEVMENPGRQTPYVAELVASQAAAAIPSIDMRSVFPARRQMAMLGSGLAVWIGAIGVTVAGHPIGPIPAVGPAAPRDGMAAVEITVTPLPYTGRKAQRFTNPSRIEVMAGSTIQLSVRGDSVRVETVEGELRSVAGQSNVFETVATTDGFLAIENGSAARRLIGLVVTPDLVPRVKVTAPGKDLFIADTKRRIPVDIEANDDIGLSSLTLRYTKVSGSGERFTFIEGQVPVTITRSSDREWRAKGVLDLGALQLQQGDMIVYRGAATDGRPNAAPTESDAFIVEITSPLMVAAEGFSQDDQMDKYALSQQMIILKTERLLARAKGMSPDCLTYNTQMIAAEQRSVRAEFVFMMGGEVAEEVIAAAGMDINEEAEAANESELAAGRMVNRGRVALVDAIRRMSRASTLLNNADPTAALPVEKAALVALQEAFSRTRYLLRALTLRERLDLSRRLSGALTLAARDRRPAPSPVADPAVVALRRALADIAGMSSRPPRGRDSLLRSAQDDIAMIAQAVIQVDASDTTLQRVATVVQQRKFDEAATLLTQVLRARLPREEVAGESPELRRLRGALAEARRAGGGR